MEIKDFIEKLKDSDFIDEVDYNEKYMKVRIVLTNGRWFNFSLYGRTIDDDFLNSTWDKISALHALYEIIDIATMSKNDLNNEFADTDINYIYYEASSIEKISKYIKDISKYE
jgi:hypothetical protein